MNKTADSVYYPMTQTPISLLENAKTPIDLLKDGSANDESTKHSASTMVDNTDNQLMIRDEGPFPKTKESTSSVKTNEGVANSVNDQKKFQLPRSASLQA